MTTKKRLEPSSTTLLNAIARLNVRVDALASQAEHDSNAIKLLVQARNDQALRLSEVESHWRQHAKVSMERYQETRALQTSLMDTNKRLGELESRVYAIDMAKVPYKLFADLWRHEDAHKTAEARFAAAGDHVVNKLVPEPAEQWVLSFGNPNDGFDYVGPFATATEAIDYGEQWMPGQEWWTILLQAPAKE